MISNELVKNKVLDLKEVLVDLSTREGQQDYKEKVPYVHIPIELIEQWSDHMRMLSEVEWYRDLFSGPEIKRFESFDRAMESFSKKYGHDMPDVDAVFVDGDWCKIMEEANDMLNSLAGKLDQLLSKYGAEQGQIRVVPTVRSN